MAPPRLRGIGGCVVLPSADVCPSVRVCVCACLCYGRFRHVH